MKSLKEESKALQRQHKILKDFCFIIWQYDKELADPKDSLSIMFSCLLGSMADTLRSILTISSLGYYRDTLALSRTVLEISINIGYFSIKDKDAIQQALDHAKQKSFRDLTRSVDIGDHTFYSSIGTRLEVEPTEELKEVLDGYTTKKGKEVRSWTGNANDSVPKKIELIKSHYGDSTASCFEFLMHNIYRHSSEIIHGTIFGALYAGGITTPMETRPKSEEEFKAFQLSEITFLLINLSYVCYSSIKIVHKHYPEQEFIDAAKKLSYEIVEANKKND
jgi:hypothetical protein